MTNTAATPALPDSFGGGLRAAVEAWTRASQRPQVLEAGEVLKPEHRKSAVFRLCCRSGVVVAKRSSTESVMQEARIYGEILPSLGLSAPALRGVLRDPSHDHAWIFLEDAGQVELDFSIDRHRVLAAAWLAVCHLNAASLTSVTTLPERTPAYYRRALARSRDQISGSLNHQRLTAGDKSLLLQVSDGLDQLSALWPEMVSSASLRPTLVHGDFVSKNVRVRSSPGSRDLEVMPLDWETAGYGPPFVDLQHIDVADYCAVMGMGSDCRAEVERAKVVGRSFRIIMEILWASNSLKTEWPDRAMRDYFPTYLRWLTKAVAQVRGLR